MLILTATRGEYEFWACWYSGNATGLITGHVTGSRALAYRAFHSRKVFFLDVLFLDLRSSCQVFLFPSVLFLGGFAPAVLAPNVLAYKAFCSWILVLDVLVSGVFASSVLVPGRCGYWKLYAISAIVGRYTVSDCLASWLVRELWLDGLRMFRERVCTVGEDILLSECNSGVGTR
jgi:hypothetical protein